MLPDSSIESQRLQVCIGCIKTCSEKLTTTPKLHFSKKSPITELKILSHARWVGAKDYALEKTDFTIYCLNQFTFYLCATFGGITPLWHHVWFTSAMMKCFQTSSSANVAMELHYGFHIFMVPYFGKYMFFYKTFFFFSFI